MLMRFFAPSGGDCRAKPQGGASMLAEEGQSSVFLLDLPEHQGGIRSEGTLAGGPHQHLHPPASTLVRESCLMAAQPPAKDGVPWAWGQKTPGAV